jgi:hypothetical protein
MWRSMPSASPARCRRAVERKDSDGVCHSQEYPTRADDACRPLTSERQHSLQLVFLTYATEDFSIGAGDGAAVW